MTLNFHSPLHLLSCLEWKCADFIIIILALIVVVAGLPLFVYPG